VAAEEGNSYWRRRLTHGKPRAFEGPKELLEACIEYLEYCDETPLKEEKAFASGGDVTKTDVNKMRVPTLAGLTTHLGINRTTWNKWRADREDLTHVIESIDTAIETVQVEGASAGLLNHNIIARLVGLVDKKETKGLLGHMDMSDMDTSELKDALLDIFKTSDEDLP
tara:strand:- start:4008 stop:4511 length:504 start_codon:yes stop_codon:yes gene_type:complete